MPYNQSVQPQSEYQQFQQQYPYNNLSGEATAGYEQLQQQQDITSSYTSNNINNSSSNNFYTTEGHQVSNDPTTTAFQTSNLCNNQLQSSYSDSGGGVGHLMNGYVSGNEVSMSPSHPNYYNYYSSLPEQVVPFSYNPNDASYHHPVDETSTAYISTANLPNNVYSEEDYYSSGGSGNFYPESYLTANETKSLTWNDAPDDEPLSKSYNVKSSSLVPSSNHHQHVSQKTTSSSKFSSSKRKISPEPSSHLNFINSKTKPVKSHNQSQSLSQSLSEEDKIDDFVLLADHPAKSLGAKITSLLGSDVITIIGSQTGNDPKDDDPEPPPAPAPVDSSLSSKRPGSGLKRSSPVDPSKKPVVNQRMYRDGETTFVTATMSGSGRASSPKKLTLNVTSGQDPMLSPSGNTPSTPSKKELWQNSTKTESMLWSTVDDEDSLTGGYTFPGNEMYHPQHALVNQQQHSLKIGIHSPTPPVPHSSQQSMMTSISGQVNVTTSGMMMFPSMTGAPVSSSSLMTDNLNNINNVNNNNSNFLGNNNNLSYEQQLFQQQQQLTQQQQLLNQQQLDQNRHKLPSVPSPTTLQQKRGSFERQNEIVIPDTESGHLAGSVTLLPTQDTMGRRPSFTLQQQQQLNQQLNQQQQLTQQQLLIEQQNQQLMPQNTQARRGSFMQVDDQMMNNQVNAVPGSRRGSFMVDPTTLKAGEASRPSSLFPTVTSAGQTVVDNYSQGRRASQSLYQEQQQVSQPASVLKTSEASHQSTAKTVTFCDDLLQERTFAPSNASSPYPESTISDTHIMNGTAVDVKTSVNNNDPYTDMNGYQQQHNQYNETSVAPAVSGDVMIAVPEVSKRSSISSFDKIPVVAVTPATDATTPVVVGIQAKKPIRTNGLQDFEPTEQIEGMNLARLRWMAAFNKIVSELDLGDPDMVSTLFDLLRDIAKHSAPYALVIIDPSSPNNLVHALIIHLKTILLTFYVI